MNILTDYGKEIVFVGQEIGAVLFLYCLFKLMNSFYRIQISSKNG
jgi:hypothetical protein